MSNDETREQLSDLSPTADINEDEVAAAGPSMSPQEQMGARSRIKNKRQLTKEMLESQPKVSVFIPETADEFVSINGYSYILKRGEQVDVPRDVANLLHNKWRALAKSNRSNIQRDHGTV